VTRLSVALLALVAVISLSGGPAMASTPPPSPPPTTLVENPFIPEDQNLSDCVSALPRPGCGSEAQGGWRQQLVFGLVLAGGAFIAWRVVRGVRRREAPAGRASASEPHGDGVRGRSPRKDTAP
jgi:hypothetical protein